MKLTFCYYGNPILRKKGETITEITDEIRELVAAMVDYFDNHNGIGMAAQQVGKALRLFVLRRYIHLPDGKWTTSEPHVYINSKIVEYSKETWVEEEACMSLPKLQLPVERPLKIKVESTKLDGTRIVEELEGINARVVMHENDHTNGVLYIDRVEDKYLKPAEAKLREIKKKYN
ncbi:MAG: peptide deformylase [Verrucomicrobia bacterium]|nr:peptide deformylase [Verrucomicrobiota bacterium]